MWNVHWEFYNLFQLKFIYSLYLVDKYNLKNIKLIHINY